MGWIFESHREPVGHHPGGAAGSLDPRGVELQELYRVGGALVARLQLWLEPSRPRDLAQLGSERLAARVEGGDTEARDGLGNVSWIRELPNEAVLPLPPALDGDTGILRRLANDLAVVVTVVRRRHHY